MGVLWGRHLRLSQIKLEFVTLNFSPFFDFLSGIVDGIMRILLLKTLRLNLYNCIVKVYGDNRKQW